MNPLHVNFAVHDLAAGVRFYSAMFAGGPAVLKPDCAQWMLNDSRAHFTIFVREASPCVIDLSGQRSRLVHAVRERLKLQTRVA